jgi:hypothetical protein
MAKTQVLASNKSSSTVKIKSLTPVDDFNAIKTESTFPAPLKTQTVLVYNTKPTPAVQSAPVSTSQTYWITG